MRYYRIALWGYGGEAAYIPLNKEQFDFWKADFDENGDENLLDYMLDEDDDGECKIEVPENADFMREPEEKYKYSWYEHPKEFQHQWGAGYSSRLTVEEVESEEWNALPIADVIDGEDIDKLEESLMEEKDYELVTYDLASTHGAEPKYILQFWSAEKGSFFEGFIKVEDDSDFDITKLKIFTSEYLNGEDVVDSISYDGNDIDNLGGDTNGKGYSVHLWEV